MPLGPRNRATVAKRQHFSLAWPVDEAKRSIDELIELGRKALREPTSDSARIARPKKADTPAIAFLITIDKEPWVPIKEQPWLFPLAAGRTLVGRGGYSSDFGDAPPIEGSQWVFRCTAGLAEFNDAHSTNLSLLFHRSVRSDHISTIRASHPVIASKELNDQAVGVCRIRHASSGDPLQQIHEGDVLSTIYASLVFAWL